METPAWKTAVAKSFNAVTEDYDRHARVQRLVAQALVKDISSLREGLVTRRILEIGCGTGDFSTRLFLPFAKASWVISDIAAKMLARAQANHNHLIDQGKPCPQERFYCCLDGEAISESVLAETAAMAGGFDLIASNLAFQWFKDLPKAVNSLRSLLRPQGHLVFSTLGEGTFSQWYQALAQAGYSTQRQSYPDALTMRRALGDEGNFRQETLTEFYPTARAFLQMLSGLGASRLKEDKAPASPGQLNQAMRIMTDAVDQGLLRAQRLDKGSVAVDYKLFYVVCYGKR